MRAEVGLAGGRPASARDDTRGRVLLIAGAAPGGARRGRAAQCAGPARVVDGRCSITLRFFVT